MLKQELTLGVINEVVHNYIEKKWRYVFILAVLNLIFRFLSVKKYAINASQSNLSLFSDRSETWLQWVGALVVIKSKTNTWIECDVQSS